MKIITDIEINTIPMGNGAVQLTQTTYYREVNFVKINQSTSVCSSSVYDFTHICPSITEYSNTIDISKLVSAGINIEIGESRREDRHRLISVSLPSSKKLRIYEPNDAM